MGKAENEPPPKRYTDGKQPRIPGFIPKARLLKKDRQKVFSCKSCAILFRYVIYQFTWSEASTVIRRAWL